MSLLVLSVLTLMRHTGDSSDPRTRFTHAARWQEACFQPQGLCHDGRDQEEPNHHQGGCRIQVSASRLFFDVITLILLQRSDHVQSESLNHFCELSVFVLARQILKACCEGCTIHPASQTCWYQRYQYILIVVQVLDSDHLYSGQARANAWVIRSPSPRRTIHEEF